MHSHGHSHGHEHAEDVSPDCLTNLGALGEAIEGIGNVFWGANVYNTLYELFTSQENENRLGWPLYIGIVFGIISLGSAYAHRRLDTYHQRTEHKHEDLREVIVEEKQNLDQPLLTNAEENKPISKGLTFFQKITIGGDAVSHVCGRAGALSGLVEGVSDTFAKVSLPAATRSWVLLGATFFGALTSASGVRTCYNTMLEQSEAEAKKQHTLQRN